MKITVEKIKGILVNLGGFLWLFLGVGYNCIFAQSKERSIDEIALVLKSTSVRDRFDAIKALWMVENDTASKKICGHYFEEDDNYIKSQIVEYAAYKKDINECVNVFVDALSNNNPALRNSAWLSVNDELLENESIRKKMKEGFKNEKNRGVKLNALRKILKVDSTSDTVKILGGIVSDEKEDEDIRIEALNELKKSKSSYAKNEIDRIRKTNIRNKKVSQALRDEGEKTNLKNVKKDVKKKNR